MSEIKTDGVVAPQDSKPEEKEKKVVSVKAYEEVSRDMHKNKQKAKEYEAELNELRTQVKLQEEAKMQEEEKWKELYEKTKAEGEEQQQSLKQEKQRYTKSVKISALKQELGGQVRDQYLNFANLDNVVIDDNGSIDSESLLAVANEFRKEHGQLIPKSDNTSITGHAASNLDNFNPKAVKDMTHAEKVEALKIIEANKN